jgi:hypothetical protein
MRRCAGTAAGTRTGTDAVAAAVTAASAGAQAVPPPDHQRRDRVRRRPACPTAGIDANGREVLRSRGSTAIRRGVAGK